MSNTFLNRVSAERRVLTVVNKRLPKSKRLTGLSRPALNRWTSILGIEKNSDVSNLLFTLALQCQRLSDRSHETFSPIALSDNKSIETNIKLLNEELQIFKDSLS